MQTVCMELSLNLWVLSEGTDLTMILLADLQPDKAVILFPLWSVLRILGKNIRN